MVFRIEMTDVRDAGWLLKRNGTAGSEPPNRP